MPRQRDLIWDTWTAAFGLSFAHPADAKRVGKQVSILKSRGATPDGIKSTIAAYRKAFPAVPCTSNAVLNQWDYLQQFQKQAAGQAVNGARMRGEVGKYTNLNIVSPPHPSGGQEQQASSPNGPATPQPSREGTEGCDQQAGGGGSQLAFGFMRRGRDG